MFWWFNLNVCVGFVEVMRCVEILLHARVGISTTSVGATSSTVIAIFKMHFSCKYTSCSSSLTQTSTRATKSAHFSYITPQTCCTFVYMYVMDMLWAANEPCAHCVFPLGHSQTLFKCARKQRHPNSLSWLHVVGVVVVSIVSSSFRWMMFFFYIQSAPAFCTKIAHAAKMRLFKHQQQTSNEVFILGSIYI